MARDSLAREYVKKKEYIRAIGEYEKLLREGLNKDSIGKVLLDMANCYQRLGELRKVIEICEEVIKASTIPSDVSKARSKLIITLGQTGNRDSAETMLNRWLQKEPNNKEALNANMKLQSVLKAYESEDEFEDDVLLDSPRTSPEGKEGEAPQSPTNFYARGRDEVTLECKFCNVMFDDEEELRNHCNSNEHRITVMSDDGRDWKYRPPPRNNIKENYRLCKSFLMTKNCRLGKQCCDAHSEEELEEWKERYDYREMRIELANESDQSYHAYAKALLKRFTTLKDPQSVLTEHIDGIIITSKPELKVTVNSKDVLQEWDFQIRTKIPLQRIVLLRDEFRKQFHLKKVRYSYFNYTLGDDCQEWVNNLNVSNETESVLAYLVVVSFTGKIYATFSQTIAFDFGCDPVLIKELCVDAVADDVFEKIESSHNVTISNALRWDTSNSVIVSCERSEELELDEITSSLFKQYPMPKPTTFQVTQVTVNEELTKNNYAKRMHELLYKEELEQNRILSEYSVKAILETVDRIEIPVINGTETHFAQGGELYTVLHMESDITEDRPAGRLILENCNTVYLASVASPTFVTNKEKVYEAAIAFKMKKVIYFKLTKECVQDLALEPGKNFDAQIQFHLNRQPLCQMHFAVDRLDPVSMVFPDYVNTPDTSSCSERIREHLDIKLNDQQRKAISCITAPLEDNVPPILIVGPFGTGKTYTLAQSLKLILQEPDTRILICTHSNSAADLYIRDYLDSYSETHAEATPLRILWQYKRREGISQVVLKYCLKTSNEVFFSPKGPWFRAPTRKDIEGHRVIITTLLSSQLMVSCGLEKGYFTHIIIDEAAQALEPECIMALALADSKTRVVFAGDYMQLNPHVYCNFTIKRGFQISLLERLHDDYPKNHPCKILLRENYRSHQALVSFSSECFYGSELKASGKPPRHPDFYPLTFFTARGVEIMDINSTSYYNDSEVREVVDRVDYIVKNWPTKHLGPRDYSKIAVLTPYVNQVQRIRSALRARRLVGIVVERVLNVQGKEFKVVILSTVRTRATCQSLQKDDPDEKLDFGFLSNAKLLNTAMTRAQSLVAVVGDPVSLCCVGSCKKLWEEFLKICDRNCSLHGMSWKDIQSVLEGFELKKIYGLNPKAPEFIPINHQNMYSPVRPLMCYPQPSPYQLAAAFYQSMMNSTNPYMFLDPKAWPGNRGVPNQFPPAGVPRMPYYPQKPFPPQQWYPGQNVESISPQPVPVSTNISPQPLVQQKPPPPLQSMPVFPESLPKPLANYKEMNHVVHMQEMAKRSVEAGMIQPRLEQYQQISRPMPSNIAPVQKPQIVHDPKELAEPKLNSRYFVDQNNEEDETENSFVPINLRNPASQHLQNVKVNHSRHFPPPVTMTSEQKTEDPYVSRMAAGRGSGRLATPAQKPVFDSMASGARSPVQPAFMNSARYSRQAQHSYKTSRPQVAVMQNANSSVEWKYRENERDGVPSAHPKNFPFLPGRPKLYQAAQSPVPQSQMSYADVAKHPPTGNNFQMSPVDPVDLFRKHMKGRDTGHYSQF